MKQSGVLLKNATLIDGTGKKPQENVSLYLEDGIIKEIISLGDMPPCQTVIEMKERTILPGIINTHIHIDFQHMEKLKKWLYAGVTTIRDMGDLSELPVEELFSLRKSVLANSEYPRVILCGKFITAPGGYGGQNPIQVSGEVEIKEQINELNNMGCDFIKTVLEDGFDPSTYGLPKLTKDQLETICIKAHRLNKKVAAHVSQTHNLKVLVEAGIDEAAHNVYDSIPDELIERMVLNNIVMTPTMNLYKFFSDKYGAPFYPICVDNLLRFIKAGGKITIGTDFIEEEHPWFELGIPYYEMKLLKEAGLTNLEIISAATKNAAELLGIGHITGTIEVGKAADLIAVEGNLTSDLECIQNVKLVIKDGVIIRNER
ncbi:MAG: hypothetical protein K0S47_2957 [Herbinix sp.]|nr:hypothetical protein [Herbinix sp.]